MKQFVVLVTACAALVVLYFVATVGFGGPVSGEPSARAAATTAATSQATDLAKAEPKPTEPPAPKLTALLPDSPGFYNLLFSYPVNGKTIALPTRLYVPRDYDRSKDPRPLVVFLHGEEERSADPGNPSPTGPFRRLRDDQGFRDNFRYLLVAPQCPADSTWGNADVAAAVGSMVDELAKTFRVDAERVTLLGTGLGGSGAWRVAALGADRFAGVAVAAPREALEAGAVANVKYLSSYVAAPQNDKPSFEAYQRTVELLGRARADVQARLAGNTVKECSQWFVNDNGTWDWISQKRRRTDKERREADEREVKDLAESVANTAKSPGEYKMKFATWVGDKKVEVPYQICLPRGYDTSPQAWPTVLFCPGAGEVNPDLSGVNVFGPVGLMRKDPRFKDWCPFITITVVHDNSPERARAIVELMADLEKRLRIDPDRVYVTGLSLGGTTTWTVVTTGPELFAAAVPISARERNIDIAPRVLKYVKTWIVVGGADGDFTVGSNHMYDTMLAGGCDVHLTVIPNEGHGPWQRYYDERRFYEWLLRQRRLTQAERSERDAHPKGNPAEMLAHVDQHPELARGGEHMLEYATQLGGKPFKLRYGLYLPDGYDKTKDRLPMTVLLHHPEQRSTDQSMIFDWGSGVDPRRDVKDRKPYPFIGLTPQLPPDRQWGDAEMLKITLGLLDEVSKYVRVDPDRVYLTGVENGGSAAWALACEAPDRFAAVFPYQGGVTKPDEVAKKLKGVGLLCMAPERDGGSVNSSKQMVEALKKAGVEAQVRAVKDAQDPNGWFPYYTEPTLVEWLRGQKRAAK